MMRPFQQLSPAAYRITQLLEISCTSPSHIQQIQGQLVRRHLYENTNIAYQFITACQSFGLLDSARLLYTQLQTPHIFICNTLIKAFAHTGSPLKAISLYSTMHKNSVVPNHYTYPFALKAFSDLRDIKQGQCLHTQIIKAGEFYDIYVQNSLLNVYASVGDISSCQKVFDIMPQRDVVSWTVMIMGYREAGKYDDALIVFEKMQSAGVLPNQVTMVNALSACSSLGSLDVGIRIHNFITRTGWQLDVILGTCLIDMYGKCGKIEEGLLVFQSMKEKNVCTWNALIKGLALAKSGGEAILWFLRMEQEEIKPDEITLLGVLFACSHSGLVQMGVEIFSSLTAGKYGFLPNVIHYACMTDLLARSGHSEEVSRIIKEMPFEPTKAVWGALLAGSKSHGDLEMSEFAALKLIELEPENSAHYVVLSNLYAEMGKWSAVEKVRTLMNERGLQRDLGCSTLECPPQDHVRELLAQKI